jgi:hypothetical protein
MGSGPYHKVTLEIRPVTVIPGGDEREQSLYVKKMTIRDKLSPCYKETSLLCKNPKELEIPVRYPPIYSGR